MPPKFPPALAPQLPQPQGLPPPKKMSAAEVARSKRIVWKRGEMTFDEKPFTGSTDLPPDISDLETPLQFFRYFLTDDLINEICEQTALYISQKNPSKHLKITTNDIKSFIGIVLLMPVVKMPSVRMYWNKVLGLELIYNAMSVNLFEKIKSNIHFSDNSKMQDRVSPDYDRLYKIRPLLDHLNKKVLMVPIEENVSVDEQICSTKARHSLKTYNPAKPHKWGYRLYFLCGASGFGYHFFVYGEKIETSPDLGAASNAVVKLSQVIPDFLNHKVFF